MADLVACSTPFLLGCGAVSLLEQISAGLEERKVKERRKEKAEDQPNQMESKKVNDCVIPMGPTSVPEAFVSPFFFLF